VGVSQRTGLYAGYLLLDKIQPFGNLIDGIAEKIEDTSNYLRHSSFMSILNMLLTLLLEMPGTFFNDIVQVLGYLFNFFMGLTQLHFVIYHGSFSGVYECATWLEREPELH